MEGASILNHHNRIQLLREYEQECYSVCFYLLKDESLAWKAAETAIMHLYRDEAFLVCFDEVDRKKKLRKTALSCSLQTLSS
jgi:hypothetical protein